jgi:hypothetical protein
VSGLEDLTTDQLLAHARALEGKAALLDGLSGNPETRETIQRAIKKLNPKLSIPEIDAADRVRAEMEPDRKRLLALEESIQKDQILARLEKNRATIKTKYNLSDADVLEVEKLMVSETDPIPSYDAAARVFVASRQSAVPTPASFSPPTFEMPEKDKWGKGIGNAAQLNKIAMDEAFSAFNEVFSGKVAGLGPHRAA